MYINICQLIMQCTVKYNNDVTCYESSSFLSYMYVYIYIYIYIYIFILVVMRWSRIICAVDFVFPCTVYVETWHYILFVSPT